MLEDVQKEIKKLKMNMGRKSSPRILGKQDEIGKDKN
jgi:hypothetical protein